VCIVCEYCMCTICEYYEWYCVGVLCVSIVCGIICECCVSVICECCVWVLRVYYVRVLCRCVWQDCLIIVCETQYSRTIPHIIPTNNTKHNSHAQYTQ